MAKDHEEIHKDPDLIHHENNDKKYVELHSSPADSGYEGQCSDSSQRTDSQESVPGPPDGGWGWVVCFAAFCSMVILDGMMFSYGVLFLELLDYFKSGKGQTAMVGSALMGVHLLAGPMTSALVNAWGVRKVSMSGAILATSAFACCILSPNITVLTILYGVIAGIGVSMIYIPSILSVGFYFEKRRALANGLTQSGSGVGAFLYAPFTDYLLTEYGWKGTMLILSGIVLNCLACGALYRPIEMPKRKRKAEVEVDDYHKPDLSDLLIMLQPSSTQSSVNSITMDALPYTNIPVHKSPSTFAHLLLSRNDKTHCFVNSVPTFKTTSLSSPNSPSSKRHHLGSLRPVYCKCQPLLMNSVYLHAPRDCKCTDSVYDVRRTISENKVYHEDSKTSINDIPWNMKPLCKKDAFYNGSLLRIPEYKLGKSSSLYSFHQAPHVINADTPADENSDCRKRIADVKSMIKHMLGLGLLGNRVFLLCMFSMVLWTTHSTVLTLLPDCAVIRGVGREQSAYLLSIIGVANTAARILAGWLSDRPAVNALYVNTVALFVGGLSCIMMAFTSMFSLLALEATVFGLCMGTWTSLRPIILVEQLGLDNLTNAFGLVAMFQGGASLIGPPIAGAIYEQVNSYIITFSVTGCTFIFSGIICCILGCFHRCGPRKHTSHDLHLSKEFTLEVDVKNEIEADI